MTRRSIVALFMIFSFCCFTLTVSAATVKLPDAGSPNYEHRTIETVPLHMFSFYTHNYLGYTYATSERDRQAYVNAGFRYEGIVAYISSEPLRGTYGLYNMYLPLDHYLAVGKESRDACIIKYGYQNTGLLGYVYPKNVLMGGNTDVHVWYKPSPEAGSIEGFLGTTGKETLAYHYYLGGPANLTDRNYEGIAFRAWSKSQTLQEIKVLAPNNGGTFEVGKKMTIQWKSTPGGGVVDLRYAVKTTTGWTAWVEIATQLSPSGNYEWIVPSQAAGEITILASWRAKNAEGEDGWAYDRIYKTLSIKNAIKPIKVSNLLVK
ncbi:MAG: hypothetical protein H6Q68_1866 [Firmicutes bacterium]|nr:hypothetical protein [Bacillota bacterium]